MKSLNILSRMLLVAGVCTALDASATIPMPDNGMCNSLNIPCLSVTNTSSSPDSVAALYATASGAAALVGTSSGTSTSAIGVYGQGVYGIRGDAVRAASAQNKQILAQNKDLLRVTHTLSEQNKRMAGIAELVCLAHPGSRACANGFAVANR